MSNSTRTYKSVDRKIVSGIILWEREKRTACCSFFCCQQTDNSVAFCERKIIFSLRSFEDIIWCKGTIENFCGR